MKSKRQKKTIPAKPAWIIPPLFMLIAFLGALFYVFVGADFTGIYSAANCFILLTAMLFTALLYVICAMDRNSEEKQQRLFLGLIGALFIQEIIALIVSFTEGRPETKALTFALYTMIYIFSDIYWIMFWYYQKSSILPDKLTATMQIIYAVCAGLYLCITLINIFRPVIFYIASDGEFVLFGYVLQICTGVIFLLYALFIFTSKNSLKSKFTLVSYFVFPLIVDLLCIIFPDNILLWNIMTSVVIVAYLIPLYLLFFNLYLGNSRKLVEQEKELAVSKANALTLQINPHFIANTLSSIAALCTVDPEAAEKLTIKFAKYLRIYYSEGGEDNFIPFAKELDNIENYLSIEQTRFSKLKVTMNITVSDFLIPTLTVQPLIENAVLHGLLPKHGNGTIKIETRESERAYIIRIMDDGVGFDKIPEDGKKHIGIANARSRLSMLCGGTLSVKGLPGKGTLSEVIIPKKEDEE